MQGWIKLHRKLICSEIFQNEKLLKVFMYCLLKATHSDHVAKVGRQKINLLPGQFVFGRKRASLELDMKESTVRDYMNILKDDEVIAITTTNKYSVITVVNWEVYQSKEEDSDNKHDSKKTAEGQQINTYKNGNNGENVKNDLKSIYEHWNSKEIIVHRSLNQKAKSHINARLEDYSLDELLTAIDNYTTILTEDKYYWTHKWTLETFMNPNNVIRFLEDSDPFTTFFKGGQANEPDRGSFGGTKSKGRSYAEELERERPSFIKSV